MAGATLMVEAFYSRCLFLGVWWLWPLPAALGNVWGLDIPPQWVGWIHPYSESGTDTSPSAQNQPTGDEAYTYDAAGNRLSAADVPGPWQYDGNNVLVGKGDYTFDYDANGNRILRQLGGEIYHYHYDVLNQLTRIEDRNGQVLAEYGYDPFGPRIWKQVDGVRTWFHYTDEGLAAELDDSGTVTRSYGFHPHSFGSSHPLFVKEGAQYYWILNDASGFPVRVVQPDGAVVWAGQHDSFGEVSVRIARPKILSIEENAPTISVNTEFGQIELHNFACFVGMKFSDNLMSVEFSEGSYGKFLVGSNECKKTVLVFANPCLTAFLVFAWRLMWMI